MSARRSQPDTLHGGLVLTVGTHRFVWAIAAHAAYGLQWVQYSAADAAGLMGGGVVPGVGTIDTINAYATFGSGTLAGDSRTLARVTSANPVWQKVPATVGTPVPTALGNVTEGAVILESGNRGRNSLMVEIVVSVESTGFYLLAHGVAS